MFCGNCGKEVENDAKFCPYCGSARNMDIELAKKDEKVENKTVKKITYPNHGNSEPKEYEPEKKSKNKNSKDVVVKTTKKEVKKKTFITCFGVVICIVILALTAFIFSSRIVKQKKEEDIKFLYSKEYLQELLKEKGIKTSEDACIKGNTNDIKTEEITHETKKDTDETKKKKHETKKKKHVTKKKKHKTGEKANNTKKIVNGPKTSEKALEESQALLPNEEARDGRAIYEDSDYILPESSIRYIDISEIENFDKVALRLARNEIYARHGRKFKSEDLQNYFGSKAWYVPTIESNQFNETKEFNEYEFANRNLIVQLEAEKGYN